MRGKVKGGRRKKREKEGESWRKGKGRLLLGKWIGR